MTFYLNLCSICLILVYSSLVEGAGKVVGGRPAKEGEFPFAVSLQYTDGTPFCGGSLLTLNRVLTACHCAGFFAGNAFSSFFPDTTVAVAGSVKITSNAIVQVRKVKAIYTHKLCEQSRYGWSFDYGLYVLTIPFKETKWLQKIPLLSTNVEKLKQKIFNLEEDTKCQAIGWGYQSVDKNGEYYNASEILNVMEVSIISWEQCQEMLCKPPKMRCPTNLKERSQFCGLGKTGDVCSGDSGGAIVCSGYYYGLTSWGPVCGNLNYPTMYQAVFDGLEWPVDSVQSCASNLNFYLSKIFSIVKIMFL